MRWTVLALFGFVVGGATVAIMLLSQHRPAMPVPAPHRFDPVAPLFAFVTCWFADAESHSTRCAELTVPEHRGVATSRLIHLKVVIIGVDQPGNAVMMISGGPGDAAGIDAAGVTGWWRFIAATPWLKQREVVLFDQRGTGLSEPDLRCPEIAAVGRSLLVADSSLAEAAATWRDAAASCHQRLGAAGIDLTGYTTDAIVRDLRSLIEALRLDRPNLIGVSFGSRVLLSYLRDADAGTRAVVLDSVYPPEIHPFSEAGQNAADGFAELFRSCAETPSCQANAPELRSTFDRVLERAATKPEKLTLDDPATGQQLEIRLDPAKLIEILFYGFYDWHAVQAIPGAIAALDRGHPEALRPLALVALRDYGWEGASHGLFLSVECHDEAPFDPPEAIAQAAMAEPRFARFIEENVPVVACPAWPMGAPDPAVKRPAASAVPALLLSGQLDIATPERWAREAARYLPHATVISLADVGHGVLSNHECASRLIGRFLDHPAEAVYDDCLLGASRPRGGAGP
jgi:pimeloyl-ACP methyl ester carboxylesterase